jgi:hypothetical protein
MSARADRQVGIRRPCLLHLASGHSLVRWSAGGRQVPATKSSYV